LEKQNETKGVIGRKRVVTKCEADEAEFPPISNKHNELFIPIFWNSMTNMLSNYAFVSYFEKNNLNTEANLHRKVEPPQLAFCSTQPLEKVGPTSLWGGVTPVKSGFFKRD
jgi:hypothetical protein